MIRRTRPLAASLCVLAASLPFAAPVAEAAEPASLAVSWGGDPEGWLALDRLRVLVDGSELQLSPPPDGVEAASIVHRSTLAPGGRSLTVEAFLRGASSVFTYVEVYHFVMRGQLDLQVSTGDAVTVEASVVAVPGVTVKPEDRYRLALAARVVRAGEPLAATAAAGTPQASPALTAPAAASAAAAAPTPPAPPAATPVAESIAAPAAAAAVAVVAAPTPSAPPAATPIAAPAAAPVATPIAAPAAALVATPVAGTCALGPVRFAFDSAGLDEAARDALRRFAACLVGRGGRVRLSGHWDALGPLDYNVALGERRAKAAAAFLAQAGVPAAHLRVVRLTESAAVCQEETRACRALNRRVEAIVEE